MTKRIAQALALGLVATPLLFAGCGSSSDNGGTGGNNNKYDSSAGGSGGSRLDGAVTPVDTGADIAITPDVAQPVDGAIVDAPLGTDAPLQLDSAAVDVAAIDGTVAIDATPAIDTAPVVCTEAVKFSGGSVTANRTLTKACSPYTIKTDIDVNGNATLTIEPGVTLRFDPDRNIAVGYSGAAKLVAVGTAADPIVFTSSNATPGAGDWMGVQLWSNTMNGTSLGYAKFDYCGSNGDACLLGTGTKSNRVTIDHVTFSHVGAGADAIWQKDRESNFVITNCTFNDIPTTPTQQYAISVYAPSFAGIDSTNVFNGGAMVQLMGGVISTNASWKNIGTKVAVTEDLDVQGTATPVLTIAAGSVFKFGAGINLSVGYSNTGSLVLAGTATSPITLTSLASTPAPGSWVGIFLWSGGKAKISYATIEYAGSDRGAITVDSNTSNLDIQNSTISNSESYGIGVRCNSTATIVNTGNTFLPATMIPVGPGPSGPEC